MKNSTDTIRNRTCDLPACSTVPQPTAPPRAPEYVTSVHILCECEALPSLRHAYLVSFCLDPEAILSLGAIWNFSKGTGLP
jgi:hypothetical protein